ncbi:MAG: hypothetical protein AAFX80_15845, partial [Cyanobacteria bacterium J06639_18]
KQPSFSSKERSCNDSVASNSFCGGICEMCSRRSEKDGCFFSLQPAIREYIHERAKKNKIFPNTNFNSEQKKIYDLHFA